MRLAPDNCSTVSRTAFVLGGTGMLGHRVVSALSKTHEVHASVRDLAVARRANIPATLHQLDVLGQDELTEALRRVRPHVVVNCVGIVKQLDAAKKAIPSIRLNALFPHELAEACIRYDAWLIHVSTDCVFSGHLPFPQAYTEDDIPDARDLYGRTKLLGELDAPSLTLRTSIIGPELQDGSGLLSWFSRQAGVDVPGFRNAWFSGLTTDAFAAIIRTLADEHVGLSGLFHVSAEPISKYDLLVALRDVLSVPCSIYAVDEPRINRVLDCSRFRERTQIPIPTWSEMLNHYGKESNVQTA